jgi:hypothetical protein
MLAALFAYMVILLVGFVMLTVLLSESLNAHELLS